MSNGEMLELQDFPDISQKVDDFHSTKYAEQEA